MKILILYIGIGSGHKVAAMNIKEELERQDKQATVQCRDIIQEKYPIIYEAVNRLYLFMLNNIPLSWKFIRDSPGMEKTNKKMLLGLMNMLDKVIIDEVEKFKPDAIVVTHAFYGGLISNYKEKHRRKTPLYAVATDFHLHGYWQNKNINKYFVLLEEEKDKLIKLGIKENQVIVSGIPVKAIKMPTRKASMTTILVCGGSQGTGKITEIAKNLKESDHIFKVNAVAGHNKRLYRKLGKILIKESAALFGHTDKMKEIMAETSIYIGNAGGLITNELLGFGIPMIFYKPILGQEKSNAEYLEQKGVAMIANSKKQLLEALDQLISNPEEMDEMRKRSRMMARPDAATKIAEEILKTKWKKTKR